MPDHMASIVDWYGPFTGVGKEDLFKNARNAARADFGSGLYMAIGHAPNIAKGRTTIQYVGIADPLVSRLYESHHRLGSMALTAMWLGEIATAGIPGRRAKKTDPHLDIVEWAHAYFLRIPVNERKTINPPRSSCIVLNRWWATDYETPAERPAARWADILEYNVLRNTANLCWFGRKGRIVSKIV